MPPARPIESVHPGKGSSSAAAMIEGLTIKIGSLVLLFSLRRCSDMRLVNV